MGKCRPMPLLAINIKCMRICAGFHRGRGRQVYKKCKRLAVLQRGEFILGTRPFGLLVTKLFAALGLRDTEDCHDISRYQILRSYYRRGDDYCDSHETTNNCGFSHWLRYSKLNKFPFVICFFLFEFYGYVRSCSLNSTASASTYWVECWRMLQVAFFTARCTIVQSAVLRLHVVCLSVYNVGGSGAHRLEILKTICTFN